MSWGRVENPKKVLKVGDTLKVLIKEDVYKRQQQEKVDPTRADTKAGAYPV